MRLGFVLLVGLALSCTKQAPEPQAEKHCELNPGKYQVQSASYLRSSEMYELFVMGAQPCVKQPIQMTNLQMAQLNVEGDAKEAKLEYRGDGSVLYLSKNYSLELISENQGPDGQMMREQSMWSPFLAGAAGMMVGSMISNAMMNKPRHYQPPYTKPGESRAFGVGGHGATPEAAKSSYSNNLKSQGIKESSTLSKSTRPQGAGLKKSTPRQMQKKRMLPKRKSRGFRGFRRRR